MSRKTSRRIFKPSESKEPWFFSVSFFFVRFPTGAGVRAETTGKNSIAGLFDLADTLRMRINVRQASNNSPQLARRIAQSHEVRKAVEDSAGFVGASS